MKPTKLNRHGKVIKRKETTGHKPPPPPIPPALLSRTPPPLEAIVAAEKTALLARPKYGHPEPPKINGVTHMQFTTQDGRTTVVCAVNCFGDFSSLKGTIRYGKLRYGEDFIPLDDDLNLLPGTEVAVGAVTPRPTRTKSAGGKREGVCAFIDDLIMRGGKTAQEICDLACTQFPGRDASATLNTVKARPSHMRRAGKLPPPFAK